MHDSNRGEGAKVLEALLCFAALFGVVILAYATGWTFGADTGRDQVTAHQHYEAAKHNALEACAGRVGSAAVECGAEAAEAAQDQSIARQDLYAQQDMAKWAFWMLVASAITLGVSIAGVWFVKRTLDATLVAVKETGKATRAMIDANEIASKSAEWQLRAYVSIINIKLLPHSPDGPHALKATVSFKNTGQTPALDLAARLYIAVGAGDSLANMPLIEHETGDNPSRAVLGSGVDNQISHITQITRFPASEIMSGDFTVVIHGFIEYWDVFKKRRETRFRHFHSPTTAKTGTPIASCPTGNLML